MVRVPFINRHTGLAELRDVQAEICIHIGVAPATRVTAQNFTHDLSMEGAMKSAVRACVGTLSRLRLFRDNVLYPLFIAPPIRLWLFGIASLCFLVFLFFLVIGKRWWVVFPIRIPPIFVPLAPYGGWIAFLLFPLLLLGFIKSLIPLRTLIRRSSREVLDELERSVFCLSIEGAGGGFFSETSAGGGFFCASAIGVLERWKHGGVAHLIPPWGAALLKEGGKYIVSTEIGAGETFQGVSGWDKKLKAVLNACLAVTGREIKVVMCSREDWRTVQQEWERLTGSELVEKKDWFSGCRSAKDLGITFLACPNVSALIKYLSPHRLRWLVLRLLAVIGFGFVLLSGTYPPTPEFAVDFFPPVDIYLRQNVPPTIKMSLGGELTLFIRVREPLSQYPFQVHVEADSESLWTELPWLVTPNPKKEVVLALINSEINSEAEKVNFKMPLEAPLGWQVVIVTMRVYDSFGQYAEKKYQFISK
jgi:hypothetical protein